MPKRAQPEAQLQRAVAQFLERALGPGVMWRMVENKPRSKIAGAQQKGRGVQAGTPDILLWWYDGFGAIELKSMTGHLRESQRDFWAEFKAIGGLYAVCRAVDNVETTLLAWKLPLRASLKAKRA